MSFARTSALLVAAALLASCGHAPAAMPKTTSAGARQPAAKPVPPACGDPAAIVSALSTPDKLAQLLMVGVRDADDARSVVTKYHIGGIFIGSKTDLSMLTDGSLADIARQAGPLPLAVSVDEEGGRVSRLSSLIGTAPSARVLGQTHSADEIYQLALDRGKQMHKLGITIDLAPVVDVSDAPDDTVIGDRSFSANPADVTQFAGAYARGLSDAGLLPVLKHFPGHGHGSGDSHTGAVTTPPLSVLQTSDLVPYRTLVSMPRVGVMIGHLEVPGLTGTDPASLSPAAIQLLRNGTGYGGPAFNGPVFSDDLTGMAAVSDRYHVGDAVLRALQAGTDTALWVTTDEVSAVLERLQKALAAGDLKMADVDASVQRMVVAKGHSPACGR